MKYARLQDNDVLETFTINENESIFDFFYIDLANQFQEVPEFVERGYRLIEGVWTAPEPEEPTENIDTL